MTTERQDPVDRFNRALNEADMDMLEGCLHPDFEMVVPQRPARGFRGRDQELANMKLLFDTYPDFAVTVLRRASDGDEIWTESVATATGLEMAAVVIWTVDRATDSITSGRYYSEPVQREAAGIDDFMRDIAGGAGGR